MADDPTKPLLACSESQGKVSDARKQSISADTSLRKLGAVEDESEITITGSEIRAAVCMLSSDFWMHNSMVATQGKGPLNNTWEQHNEFCFDEVMKSVQALKEDEIRELLFDHFSSNCCWGTKNASKWSIQTVEDCNSYIGTLETFIEERIVVDEAQPYIGGDFNGKDKGMAPDAWVMDMKAESPLLFVSGKEARKKIPNSEVIRVCEGCLGCGKLASKGSKPKRELRQQVPDQMIGCCMGCGRGPLGSICKNCRGLQQWMECKLCSGQGALLHRKVIVVTWKTVMVKRVCATKNAKSVPDEVFDRVKGVRLYQSQNYQCEPASFPNSNTLSNFSELIISERIPIPETARIICERHRISLMPVTRVVMANKNKSLKLYILGPSKEIYTTARRFSLCGICNIC